MVYVGMDIHKNYSSVAVIDEVGDLVDRRRVSHRHREELTGYFNQFPLKTQVVMEATCGWGWLSEVLHEFCVLGQDLGLEVKLANPSKVKIIAESQIKTDKVDALALAQLLRTNFLPESYLAPKDHLGRSQDFCQDRNHHRRTHQHRQ